MAENNKTYIWVRPSSLPGHTRNNNTVVSNKKRGAPTESEEWGWLPGYYETKEESSTHYYTLIPLDDELDQIECELKEDQTATLLECGDLVPANAWEGLDFTRKSGFGNTEEDSYNYDSSSNDEDDMDSIHDGAKHIFTEKPNDAPPSNLIELTHLHEPSVVHALRHRFKSTQINMNGIYTDTGPILLAVNPFKPDESGELYGPAAVEKYRSRGEKVWLENRGGSEKKALMEEDQEETLGPHVYAVADRTFRIMMTKLHPVGSTECTDKRGSILRKSSSTKAEISNQSVLVSGESGAGKTVTTKLLMGYLSQLSQNPLNDQSTSERISMSRASFAAATTSEMSIERRVLESNPIMESFGNARTVRNDNSSIFGKYIEMKFNATKTSSSLGATLACASIETYLLEKVRLVHQSPGERNYHIFYELFSLKYDYDECNFFDSEEEVAEVLDRFGLSQYEMEDFALINASGTYDRRDNVRDSSTFSDLCSAMSVMGFEQKEQMDVFAVTCAFLHLSNVTFDKIGEVECTLEQSHHLDYVVDLLGITKEGLNNALCYYEITVKGETHRKTLSVDQAGKGVEALIKATYGTMFGYLCGRINASISGDGSSAVGLRAKRGDSSGEASIGILDIFGFESFQNNSFEQLCINYCNEALQQQFNRFVLRNEQEEYDREGIPWTYIEFPENQEILDLIDFKGTGIINILHDQSRTPGSSDKSFSNLMYEKCSSHPRFEADAMMKGKNLFGIHHYAGLVEYQVDGFMEKNRDELPKESADLLLSSSNEFIKMIANEMVQRVAQSAPGKRTTQRLTVGMQFSAQLQELRRKIDETSPHYVRCLKPNYMLVPDVFDAALIADQLRCAGVIEAVRVSRLGYPQRYSHASFISQYKVLGMKACKKKMADKRYNPAKALVHTITKQILTASVNDDQTDVGIQVGKTKIFLRQRCYDLLEKLRTEKMTLSAVRIQSFARRVIHIKRYQRACASILTLQCFIRRAQAKAIVMKTRFQHNSLVIQKMWRKYSALKLLISAKAIAKWSQSHYRGNVGRAEYSKVNRERRALQIQTCGRRYIAMNMFKRVLSSALVIQCARRCHLSRLAFNLKKAHARDMNVVVQERDKLRSDMIALKAELQKAKEDSKPQPPSEDIIDKLKKKDEEIETLRSELDRITIEKETLTNSLQEAKEAIQHVKSDKERVLKELEELKSFNQALEDENRHMTESFSNLDEIMLLNAPPAPVTAEVERALDEAVRKITELEQANKKLKAANESLQNSQMISTESCMIDNEIAKKAAPMQTYVDAPALPLTSVYTTATTDNMTTDTEDEIARLREENHVLQNQLQLLRNNNQGILPEIMGSDQEYEESVNPSDNEDEDESSGFDSANVPAKLMNRICHEVEEATEEVIIKTRAESEAKINKLQNEISELRQELAQAKRVAKYDLDDMARANRSLRQELEEANEEVNRVYAELEDKCDEFDALNEDTERFAETFAAQHEEVRLLERKNRRLQEENTQLKALDAANTKRISELQKASLGRTDSVSTPDDTGRRMWKELAKMRREIAHMKHDNSTAPKKSAHNARGHREQDGSCSDISSDEEEWNENEPSDAS